MKILKYILFTAVTLTVLGSCKKQLDVVPTDVFSDVNAFRTIADAQMGTYEAYARYGVYNNDAYESGLIADEAKIGFDNAGQGALTYRYQYSSDATTGGDVTGAYYGYYSMIDQVNRVLAKLPTVIATAAEEPRRNILKGQLLALRAIAHFGVLQSYCKSYSATDAKGIPIMLVSDPLIQPARATIGAAVTQIETDLNDASALLPAVTPATFSDTVMNQVNINAYRARIALYKGDYQKAVDYSTLVINSAVKTLATGTGYSDIWTDNNMNETLFRIRYSTGTNVGALWTTTSGLIYIAPSDKLIATYGTGDIRKAAFIGTTSTPGKNYVNKFYTSPRGGRVLDMKACRISEMYLIRAEAYAKLATPNITAGAADLNALRAARISPYTAVTFATATDLVNAVLDERYKELCFEGFRLFDLKRNNLPVQRNASDVTASAWQTLPAGNYRFVLPIPQSELLANPNMVQNDGY